MKVWYRKVVTKRLDELAKWVYRRGKDANEAEAVLARRTLVCFENVAISVGMMEGQDSRPY